MPASGFDVYYMQDARNNFEALRPTPICTDANQFVGQCRQKIHISTNCYYGYHEVNDVPDPKNTLNECEMMEVPATQTANHSTMSAIPMTQLSAKKRSADDYDYPNAKRHREEVQIEKNIVPETTEILVTTKNDEDLETLFWKTHGGTVFHLLQCL